SFFLFFDRVAVQLGDGPLDRLDGLVLVYRVNVHGDDLAGFHAQKVFQQLVAEVGRRDGQKAHGPVQAAHLTGTGVECEGAGGNEVLGGKARPGQVFPVKSKFGSTGRVEQV